MYLKINNNTKGFTLIEMLVAVSIFSMVVVVALGAVVSIMDANRKAQALKSVINNLNFAMEAMTRNIRQGYGYYCSDSASTPNDISNAFGTNDCNAGTFLVFTLDDASGEKRMMYAHNDSITKTIDVYTQIENEAQNSGPMTAPQIIIDDMRFNVVGTNSSTEQPKVQIIVRAHTLGKNSAEFELQTTVTQNAR